MFHKGEVPFVRFLVPLIFGILCAYHFPQSFFFDSGLEICALLLGIFLALLFGYKTFGLYRFTWIFGLLIHFFFFSLGFKQTIHRSERYNPSNFIQLKADLLILNITSEPLMSSGNYRFEAEVRGVYAEGLAKKASGKINVYLEIDCLSKFIPTYGNSLIIPARYNPIEPSYNPGEFDYKLFMENRQIYFQTFIKKNQFRVLPVNMGNPAIGFALKLRKKLIVKYNHLLPDQDAAALASTLILGYRAELSNEIVEAYSKTGTMHVLSVSGMHVGIVFLVLSFLFKPLDKFHALFYFRIFLIVAAIWFYAMISGFSSPVCRAALMISLVVIGKALHRNLNSYHIIAISAFFLLLYNPFFLFDVGFQLSYLAVFGLVYFHPKLYQLFHFHNKIFDYLWSYCALSIAAQLATFPLGLYYFHQFPLYFLLSNLLILLPVTLIMYLGILLLFIPFKEILIPLGECLSSLIELTNHILFRIEKLPFASLSGLWISFFQLFLIFTLIFTLVFWLNTNRKIFVFSGLAFFLVLLISLSRDLILNQRREELIFFSLRKNTAISYINGKNNIVLADFDSSDKIFSYSIKPTLEKRGCSDIRISNIDQSSEDKFYWSDSNFMQFGKIKVLRWDKNISLPTSPTGIKVDILLISQIPMVKLSALNDLLEFKKIIIEAPNSDFKIKSWLVEAEELGIPTYVLKKSPALVMKL